MGITGFQRGNGAREMGGPTGRNRHGGPIGAGRIDGDSRRFEVAMKIIEAGEAHRQDAETRSVARLFARRALARREQKER